jgi:predicted PurR-regulated permease PerM
MPRGIGLLTIYGVAALTRNVLEPKFLGAQLGLSPLLTLVAIYAGWKLAGFAGMLLLPIAAMVLSQLWQGTRTLSQPEKRP